MTTLNLPGGGIYEVPADDAPDTGDGNINVPDWMKQSPSEPELPKSSGGAREAFLDAWNTNWLDASDREKWAADHPTANTIYKYGRRMAAETALAIPYAVAGSQYGAPLGPGGRLIGGVLGGAFGGIQGLVGDVFLGNQLGNDLSPGNVALTGAGGAFSAPAGPVRGMASPIARRFEAQNVRPTMGAQSTSPMVRWTEQKLAEMPYLGGDTTKAVNQMYEDWGKRVDEIIGQTDLTFGSSAGEAVQGAAFKIFDKGRKVSDDLYDSLSRLMPEGRKYDASELFEFLQKKELQGAAAAGNDPTLKYALDVLREGNGSIGWKELEAIRRKANKLAFSTSDDVDRGLNQTIADFAKKEQDDIIATLDRASREAGGQSVEKKAWDAANRYSKKYIDWKKRVYKKIEKLEPEEVLNAISNNPSLTEINKIKSAVGGAGSPLWDEVRSLVIREMMRPKGGNLNAGDDVFLQAINPNEWLKNYNKLAKDSNAAKAFFGDLQEDMDQLAGIMRTMSSGSQYANRSKTASALLFTPALASAGALYTGNTGLAAFTLSPQAIGFVTNKVMTNPKLIKWLAKGSRIGPNDVSKRLTWADSLVGLATAEGYKDEGEELRDFLSGSFDVLGNRIPDIPN